MYKRNDRSSIFPSYVSQDAVAAQRICDALRTAALEARFDRRDLRGGDAWDTALLHAPA
jgi:hypothetical protein